MAPVVEGELAPFFPGLETLDLRGFEPQGLDIDIVKHWRESEKGSASRNNSSPPLFMPRDGPAVKGLPRGLLGTPMIGHGG
jgi:hypothetical protein